jgi:hypothetical protein
MIGDFVEWVITILFTKAFWHWVCWSVIGYFVSAWLNGLRQDIAAIRAHLEQIANRRN